MCGIVGGVAQRDIAPILVEGLRRLEYRGYDSAGVVVLSDDEQMQRRRAKGKVAVLADELHAEELDGGTGVAHTRWATHGPPSTANAHPHQCGDLVALVHNGIIENHDELRADQLARGHEFDSQTDTETIVHEVHDFIKEGMDLLAAVQATIGRLHGAYGLGVVARNQPGRLVAARSGSPLVIGLGIRENFIASDIYALLPVTQNFIFLEEGDIADIRRDSIDIYDKDGQKVERPVKVSQLSSDAAEKGDYRHYMEKEIYEQPAVLAETLEGRVSEERVLVESFGLAAPDIFAKTEFVQIVACGTSYHAGLIAKYWMESLTDVPCNVEVASEYRYRKHVVRPNGLFVTISQSGETADTLAALQLAKEQGFGASLSICNVPESSLVRESDLVFMTRAGAEIGVASTKAFTTQLIGLLLLVTAMGRQNHGIDEARERELVTALRQTPARVEAALGLDEQIKAMAEAFNDKHHTLFLGRGEQYPVAMEGALKLKEISYIHAEAYPAGELKHGPLALIDEDMPVVAVAPNNELLEKLNSNLQEVAARGGELFVFADDDAAMGEGTHSHLIRVPKVVGEIAPIIYTIPLQLLSYHVAVLKGTDVDQPRNLAKSVTVE